MTDDSNYCGTNAAVIGSKALIDESGGRLVLAPGSPEGFEDEKFVTGVCLGKGVGSGNDFFRVTATKFALAALSSVDLGELQVFKKLIDGSTYNHGSFHEWT